MKKQYKDVEIDKLELADLQKLTGDFKIDQIGPKSVLKDRIIRHLKSLDRFISTKDKKRKKKAKKEKIEKIVDLGDEDVELTQVELVPEVLNVDPEFSGIFERFQQTTMRNLDIEKEEEDEERSAVASTEEETV